MVEWDVWDQDYVDSLAEDGWVKNPQHGKAYLSRIAECLEGTSLLDVACGAGRLVPFIPDEMSYTGIDSSAPMLRLGASRHPQRTFQEGDIYTLETVAQHDCVAAISVLIHLPDVEQALKSLWSRARICLVFNVRVSIQDQVQTLDSSPGVDFSFPEGRHLILRQESADLMDGYLKGLPDVENVEFWDIDGTNGQRVYKITRNHR